jgi:hypothetical protein
VTDGVMVGILLGEGPNKFNVCGSVHLGNKCFYSSPTECTVQYSHKLTVIQ